LALVFACLLPKSYIFFRFLLSRKLNTLQIFRSDFDGPKKNQKFFKMQNTSSKLLHWNLFQLSYNIKFPISVAYRFLDLCFFLHFLQSCKSLFLYIVFFTISVFSYPFPVFFYSSLSPFILLFHLLSFSCFLLFFSVFCYSLSVFFYSVSVFFTISFFCILLSFLYSFSVTNLSFFSLSYCLFLFIHFLLKFILFWAFSIFISHHLYCGL
jgi:hypothetical protein